MKRLMKWVPVTAVAVLLAGCGTSEGDTSDTSGADTAGTVTTADTSSVDTSADTADNGTDTNGQEDNSAAYYRPRFENHLYSYAGEGNEFAAYTMYPQFTDGRYTQYSFNNGGTQTVRVLEYTEEEIREVFTRNETYFRENFIERLDEVESEQPGEILLQTPLEVGHSWESPSGSVSEITSMDALVDIPFGEFEAVEVTRTYDDATTRDYFVHEVGLIKTEFEPADGSVVTSEMESVEEQPETQTLQVYHPDEQALELVSSQMELNFQTNDVTRDVLADALKNIPDYAGEGLIGPNVEINTLYLNQDGRVYVDFSEELVTEMNAGSGVEGMILQGIVNTLGGCYGADEVYLTVEQEPYESGHIVMEEGQFMEVDEEVNQ